MRTSHRSPQTHSHTATQSTALPHSAPIAKAYEAYPVLLTSLHTAYPMLRNYNSHRVSGESSMRPRTLIPLLVLTPFLFAAATGTPLLHLLARFTAFGVPAIGPDEHP